MIKSQLARRIAAQNPHLYARDVDRLIKAILDEIVTAMARRDRVETTRLWCIRRQSALSSDRS